MINQDKDIVVNGRTPLKDIDADLRDRVVSKLYNKMIELEAPQYVETLWRGGQANRVEYHERQKIYNSLIDEFLIQSTDGQYSGSSQLHIPMPLIVVKSYHARMYAAIMGVDPPFTTKARTEASLANLATVTDTLRYYLQDGANQGKGVEEVVDRWVWQWCATGTGYMKWRWDCQYESYIDVVQSQEPGTPQIIAAPSGEHIAVPTTKMVEKEELITRKIFEGPQLDLIKYEDIIVSGNGDPDIADSVLHRSYMTASQLWTLADRKIFKTSAVEAVIEKGPQHELSGLGNDMKVLQEWNAGMGQIKKRLDRYEIIEAHLKMDVEENGITSDVVCWIHLATRELLGATYLRRVSQGGKRPFVKAVFMPREGHENGIGLLEMIYPLSLEMDAVRNMALDAGMLSTMPFGFYRASSSLDPTTIKLEPGALIPLDNPQQDVFFPNLGNRAGFGLQQEQAIHTMIERLTGISDLTLGVMSGGQGATRTATGSRIMSNELSSSLDIFLKRLNRGWKKCLTYLLDLLQHRIPAGTSFRVVGNDGANYWRTVRNTKDLEGLYDIELSPTTGSSNQQLQVELAQQILQTTSNPLDLQLGVVTAQERYEALKNFYQALGIKDWRRFLVKIDESASLSKLSPEEIGNRLLHGHDMKPSPTMDLQGYLEWFQMVHDTDELLGQFSEDQTIKLARFAKQAEGMLQALKQVQAQAANTRQMQINSSQSAQQTAPAMGASGQGGPTQ
jgi:hypothetical protein